MPDERPTTEQYCDCGRPEDEHYLDDDDNWCCPDKASVVEREFETDDKGRTMVVCILCGEVRAYKTKGEGRCCVRTTHKWRPIAKINRDDGGRVDA